MLAETSRSEGQSRGPYFVTSEVALLVYRVGNPGAARGGPSCATVTSTSVDSAQQ